jgi:hypothetical protein
MHAIPEDHVRRLEILFADEDEAIVLDVNENRDASDVAVLIKALEAPSMNEAERRLRRIAVGPRPMQRLGSHHRRPWFDIALVLARRVTTRTVSE